MTRRGRLLLLTVVFALGESARAEDPPKAGDDGLVPNPEAAAWESSQPGAWVLLAIAGAPGLGSFEVDHKVRLVLAERTPNEVVTWSEVTEPRSIAQQGGHRVIDARVSPAEASAAWSTLDGPATRTESKETLTVGTTKVACTVVDMITKDQARVTGHERIWWSSAVPGGLVRRLRMEDGKVVKETTVQAVAFGAKPGKAFAWPAVVQEDLKLAENPEFAGWAGFPVGAWVRMRAPASGPEPATKRTLFRLMERRPNRVVIAAFVEDESLDPTAPAKLDPPGGAAPSDACSQPGVTCERIERRILAHMLPQARKADGTVAWQVGKEEISIAGKKLSCITRTRFDDAGDMKTLKKSWHSPEVPGGLVKRVFEQSMLGDTTTETTVVEAWGK
jgi:hypothetical protein